LVKKFLENAGVNFILTPQLVRGLDYYNRTTFEIQTEELGAQNAVAGGGRYDGLVKLLGGPNQPAIGFAVGVERIIALLEEEGRAEMKRPDLFVAALGNNAEKTGFNWVMDLRKSGLWVEMDYGGKGLKSQMKKAGRFGVKKVLIVGDDELASGKGVLRDMDAKDQEEVNLVDLTAELVERLKTDG
jgi:histidyl-tRNA synthetase